MLLTVRKKGLSGIPTGAVYVWNTSKNTDNFCKFCLCSCCGLDELSNPFEEENSNLIAFDTKEIVDVAVVEMMYNAKKLGQEKYDEFKHERLDTTTIQHSKLPQFCTTNHKASNS